MNIKELMRSMAAAIDDGAETADEVYAMGRVQEVVLPALALLEGALQSAIDSEDPGIVTVIEYPDPRDRRLSKIREVSYTEGGETLAIICECLRSVIEHIEGGDIESVYECVGAASWAMGLLPECMEVNGGH